MNQNTTMDTRSERMLDLLAEGASARTIAKKLGYSEGTVRVYLHNLYRTIGVRNKTEAVIWYLQRTRPAIPAQSAASPMPRPAPMPPAESVLPAGNGFGDMALSDDLYTALGIMGSFVGPYGQLWEAGLRLKGTPMDEALVAQSAQSRLLWRAVLKADFAYGKLLYDEGHAERIGQESAADAAMLVCLLALGGYSAAATRLVSSLADKRRGAAAMAGRELALMRAATLAVSRKSDSSLEPLHSIAAEKGRATALKQLAMAALFHVHRARKRFAEARQTADALWTEAELARQQLEAMGVRPLAREAAVPPLGVGESAVAASRKAALAR